jgi:16S rRNA (guanine527-N7)-methyltransferase
LELTSLPSLLEQVAAEAEAVGLRLSAGELILLERYYRLLETWNRTINLTALPLQERSKVTIQRLLIEPLIASQLVENTPLSWIDLGSGGGSPAIPLKIVRPATTLALVESRVRKAAFLNEAVRTLDLPRTTVVACRIEELLEADQSCPIALPVDLVTSRGVRLEGPTARVVAALLRPGGRALVFGGLATQPEIPELSITGELSLPSGRLLTLTRIA